MLGERAIYNLVSTDAAILAKVSIDQIEVGQLDQEEITFDNFPWIRIYTVSNAAYNVQDGPAKAFNGLVALEIYAQEYQDCEEIERLIQQRLDFFIGTIVDPDLGNISVGRIAYRDVTSGYISDPKINRLAPEYYVLILK